MTLLSSEQREAFARDGYLVVAGGVGSSLLDGLRRQLGDWIAESRAQGEAYGETIEGLPRFDLAAEHSAAQPALRRVNNPPEVSERYAEAAFEAPLVDMVAELIGPDVKFHHGKINTKLPGSGTRVEYHQDFSYTPHTNDDMVTALLLLDDMTEQNGCLMVVPGSHREGQKSLWQDDRFTGKVDAAVDREARARAVAITGKAGDACLMHTQLLHGSDANRSALPRSLFITVYCAADAWPLAASPLPNRFEGRIVRGRPQHRVRLMEGEIELPAAFKASSFFVVQEQAAAARAAETTKSSREICA